METIATWSWPPFEQRALVASELSKIIGQREDSYILQNYIAVRSATEIESETHHERIAVLVISAMFWTAILTATIAFLVGINTPWVYLTIPAMGAIVLMGLGYRGSKRRRLLRRTISHSANLFLVLAIGFGIPVGAFYLFTGGQELLVGLASSIVSGALISSELALTTLGHLLQVTFIIVVSLLPALLYFLFDRLRLKTLQWEFRRNIFRLDPYMQSLRDVEAKYGDAMEETYGTVDLSRTQSEKEGRLLPGTRGPILLATLIVTIGWILTLMPSGMNLVIQQPGDLFALFVPQLKAVSFAFLGAYYFALLLILRSYARRDLKPKAYTHITVRIIVVIILAWILELVIVQNQVTLLLVAFFIGIFPDRGLMVISEFASLISLKIKLFPGLGESDPLTSLSGIDLYDRARLRAEGVTNIEGLAHSNLIDLILQTRIPAARVVDWVDQAILHLHVATDSKVATSKGKVVSSKGPKPTLLRNLNLLGIRTATDLMKAAGMKGTATDLMKAAGMKELAPKGFIETTVKKIGEAIEEEDGYRLEVLLDVLLNEEWLPYLWHWHEKREIENRSIKLPDDMADQSTPENSLPA